MAYARQRALAAILGMLVLSWTGPGCSGSARESGAVGTSGAGASAIGIKTSSLFVTIENRTGGPLVNLRVTINPVGGLTVFTHRISRLEAGEKRDVWLSAFRAPDGAPFNRVFVRPKNVVVSATDPAGENYELSAPWQS